MNFHLKSYVCIHVFENARPILLVSRPDGDWCFLCGDDHENSAKSYRVVGMGHVLNKDPTLESLLDLQPDWEAERENVKSGWGRKKIVD